MPSVIWVGLGGFAGASARYLLGLLPVCSRTKYPFMTMLINIAGAFLIGIISGAAAREGGLPPSLVLFLKVGLCGGFTTFSSFSLETLTLFQNGQGLWGCMYAAGSFFFCLLAVWAGQSLAG